MRKIEYPGKSLNYLSVYPDDFEVGAHSPLIVCLHGFGADKHDLSGLASALALEGCLFVYPNGPIAAYEGIDPTARAWHERGGNESPESVRDALAAFDGFMHEVTERYRTPPDRTLLLGFSQGGAIALRYGLPRPERFAGIAVLSCSLRRVDDLVSDLPSDRKQPLFVAHGRKDSLVPLEWSTRLVAFLNSHDYHPEYKTYPIDHQISPTEVTDLRTWLMKILPGKKR